MLRLAGLHRTIYPRFGHVVATHQLTQNNIMACSTGCHGARAAGFMVPTLTQQAPPTPPPGDAWLASIKVDQPFSCLPGMLYI